MVLRAVLMAVGVLMIGMVGIVGVAVLMNVMISRAGRIMVALTVRVTMRVLMIGMVGIVGMAVLMVGVLGG